VTKPGHEVDSFEYRGYAEDSLFANAAKQESPVEQPEPAIEDLGATAVKPVAEVLEDLEKRRAERAELEQQLIARNWMPGWIQRELDAKFPDLKPVEQQYKEDQQREAAARRHAQTLHGPKRQRSKKLRNTRSPRDTGPPPHIAEDVRRAQGLIE